MDGIVIRRVKTYASFVRVSHSVFALPFALAGALLGSRHAATTWGTVAWILVAMVAARSAAMGFNRWLWVGSAGLAYAVLLRPERLVRVRLRG